MNQRLFVLARQVYCSRGGIRSADASRTRRRSSVNVLKLKVVIINSTVASIPSRAFISSDDAAARVHTLHSRAELAV